MVFEMRSGSMCFAIRFNIEIAESTEKVLEYVCICAAFVFAVISRKLSFTTTLGL